MKRCGKSSSIRSLRVSLRLLVVISICLFVFTLLACQRTSTATYTPSNSPSIVGGDIVFSDYVEKQKIPRVARAVAYLSIERKDSKNVSTKTMCTGTLIADDLVLTAGHCVESVDGKLPSVGVYFQLDENTRVPVNAIVVHEDLEKTSSVDSSGITHGLFINDIALIRLSHPVLTIEPAVLSKSQLTDRTLVRTDIYGIGLLGKWNTKVSHTAQDADIVDKRGTLLKHVNKNGSVDSKYGRILFSQEDGHGFCFGDSGGPAFVTQNKLTTLISINSHMSEFNDSTIVDLCRGKSYATLVAPFTDWIDRTSLNLGSAVKFR